MGWDSDPKKPHDGTFRRADCKNCDYSKRNVTRMDVEMHGHYNRGHTIQTTD